MKHRRHGGIPSIHRPIAGAIAAAIVTLLAGCATPADQTAAPREEKVYRTGSNLPQRESSPSDVKILDPSSIDRPIRSPGSPTTGSGG